MKFLTDNSHQIYVALSEKEYLSDFTFVGGSALAYYLNHRLSEDLDFFTWKDTLPTETNLFIQNLTENHKIETANFNLGTLDIFIDGCKVTFFANDWIALKEKRKPLWKHIYIADPDLLCAMKVNALSLRAKYRDYYDLYVLNREKYDIKEMWSFAEKFIPGITKKLFAMQLTYISDIDDENIGHLNPRIKISLKEIQKHFENEIEKIL